MKMLRIGVRGFELPLAVASEAIAILAKRGAGKTTTAKAIVEEVLNAGGVQVVVLDPVGVWWGLRVGASGGARGGYDIALFGGEHGDLPLEPSAGKLLAETVVDSGQSIVLDVSHFDFDGQMQQFVYQFCERLYTLKQKTPTPLLLVLEEADEFAPQDTRGKNTPRMVGAINRIVKRGRNRGVGVLAVTQRSAALNKNTLDQADTLIVMRTIGPRDRKAIEGWVEHQQAEGFADVVPSLPSLDTGEAWVWNPERKILERIQIRRAKTLDVRPPKPGETAPDVDIKPIDLETLGEQMQATVERVKANDPAELKKQIRELQRKLDERPAEAERVEVPFEVPVLLEPDAQLLRGAINDFEGNVSELRTFADWFGTDLPERLQEAVRPLVSALKAVSGAPAPLTAGGRTAGRDRGPDSRDTSARREPPAAPPKAGGGTTTAPPRPPVDDGFEPSRPQQKLLDALAWFEAMGLPPPRRSILAPMADTTSKSSGFEKNLSTLRTAGQIDYGPGSTVFLTETGRARAQPVDVLLTVEGLQEAIIDKVSRPQGAIVRVLINEDGEALSREEVADRAGTTPTSSGFEKNVSTLKTLGIIEYPQRGFLAASPLLFGRES